MKAYFRKSDLELGYVPDYENVSDFAPLNFDWSKSYEYWQPECFNGLNEDQDYNMILLIHVNDKPYLVWVNSIDFAFE